MVHKSRILYLVAGAIIVLMAGWAIFGGNGGSGEADKKSVSSVEGLAQTKQEAVPESLSDEPTLEEINAFLTDDDIVLGHPDAPVTIVEFGDYQCTFCTKFFKETKPALEEKYIKTGKAKIVFRDLAINGSESVAAAESSGCAAEQGKFWEYHNKLYTERRGYQVGVFKKNNLIKFAGEVGLDKEQFQTCYDERRYKDEVLQDTLDAQRLGLRGTPSFIINGEPLQGALPLSVFEQYIEKGLSQTN